MTINLENYPSPNVIEPISFEQILSEMQTELIRLFPAIEPTLALESALANKLLQVADYREMLVRARINDAAKANLLAFALGADLDHLATFYGVERLDTEGDEDFRARLLVEIKGRSTGGSSYWYQAAALRADVRIKAAVVYREALYPVIHIAILSKENGGIPDKAMLDAVTASVMSERVRLVNDTIIVEAAVNASTNVEADIWLLPNSSTAIVEILPDVLRGAWALEASVGFDLEPSWIEARLHVAGVKKVNCLLPVQAVIADPGVAIALGDIKLNFKGYDY
ncbi:baseplate J/gp47 family protein [Brucella pseudogrignonensis]|uniref:Phage-related baseplate assembly protein n=1 Tax=Brucella pseudogrignonensis TaxID=419475 RepID=A0ABU1M5G3_9HYPH|nr:baseplate J/gp47 family protein [Brucella pseudogrignonensis]MDR6431305.1 phage-related baseplate assembly protein [Brucella pseudogrignonensis]